MPAFVRSHQINDMRRAAHRMRPHVAIAAGMVVIGGLLCIPWVTGSSIAGADGTPALTTVFTDGNTTYGISSAGNLYAWGSIAELGNPNWNTNITFQSDSPIEFQGPGGQGFLS